MLKVPVADLSELLTRWQPQDTSPGRLEHAYNQLESWIDDTFDQFDAWLTVACRERQAIDKQLADAQTQRDRYTEQLETELQKLRGELANLHEQLQTSESEKTKRQEELQAARKQNASLTADIEQLRQELEQLRAHNRADKEQASSHENEFQALITQNTALENELENVRGRAAEMSGLVDQYKQQLSEERQRWSIDLREMRQLLEQQSELIANRATTPIPSHTTTNNEGAQPAIVGSVRQQFEKIRADYAAHRAARFTGGG